MVMKRLYKLFVVLISVLALSCGMMSPMAQEKKKDPDDRPYNPMEPVISMKTSMGEIKFVLFASSVPATVENFIQYVSDKFYDGTIFHRVIPGFVIQGGGFTRDMKQKKTRAPIRNEANRSGSNELGSLAMARTNDPHSATSQFFINLKDNNFLDFSKETVQGWGYTTFARVIEGMDVVRKIAQVKTGDHGRYQDVPVEPVIIERMTIESYGGKPPAGQGGS